MSPLPQTEKQAATEYWRPRYHFTPRRHWMNDPNGLVFHDGEYHLYFQHNPLGEQWGNISWGHAVSTDLVSWDELAIAIPATERVMAFSGSVVIDYANTSGFAPADSTEPALVAIFTGFDPATKIQSQHLAYSLDRGRNYTPYANNPVIDIQSMEFRDPKVFWHRPSQRWIMLIVAALQQEMWLYTSNNLKDWTRTSTFGPAGSAANNIWEVPDLVELPVRVEDGSTVGTRWVLFISVNHGAPWGGSGVQYFIGDFDGSRFIVEDSGTLPPLLAPEGDLVADFEGGRLPPGWLIDGPAFGAGPVAGMIEGQPFVSGHLGRGLMNSFHGGDASTGTLTSPPFTVTHRFLNFQLAGGATRRTRLELQFDGRVVHEACGQGDGVLRWASWDVSALLGRQAVLRAVDEATETGGYLLLDHIVMTDEPVHPPSVTDITLWADHGRDFYAPICFGNVPDGRVLWMGWMSNWDYARQLPSKPWRGQMSGVRELDLVEAHDGLRLRQRVAREMEALLESPALAEATAITAAQAAALLTQSALSSRHLMARLEVLVQGLNSPVGLEVFKSPHEAVRVGFDPQRKTFFVDRRTTSPSFVGQSERHDALRLVNAPRVLIEIWIDGSTIEMFADGGTVVISDLAYPRPEATCVGMFHGPENPMITRLTVHTVRATMHTPAR